VKPAITKWIEKPPISGFGVLSDVFPNSHNARPAARTLAVTVWIYALRIVSIKKHRRRGSICSSCESRQDERTYLGEDSLFERRLLLGCPFQPHCILVARTDFVLNQLAAESARKTAANSRSERAGCRPIEPTLRVEIDDNSILRRSLANAIGERGG
jgi:hypothetical protein